jgi:hypothetical protein
LSSFPRRAAISASDRASSEALLTVSTEFAFLTLRGSTPNPKLQKSSRLLVLMELAIVPNHLSPFSLLKKNVRFKGFPPALRRLGNIAALFRGAFGRFDFKWSFGK